MQTLRILLLSACLGLWLTEAGAQVKKDTVKKPFTDTLQRNVPPDLQPPPVNMDTVYRTPKPGEPPLQKPEDTLYRAPTDKVKIPPPDKPR